MKNIKLKQLLQILLAVGITAAILRTFVIDSFVVEGDSMSPTILSGDYIFIDRISHYFKNFSRGDIIVVNPRSDVARIIKRIIGLPGETIQISNNEIKINGRKLKEDYIPADFKTLGEVNLKLKNDQFFVLGDNRELSNDSRIWGILPKDKIIGRAQLIFYPHSKIKWLERTSYNI